MDPAGRVALVTGAGRRLGREFALALGRAGSHVALHYHASGKGAHDTAEELRTMGVRAELFQADLRDADAPEALVDAAHTTFGALHILVNSAAIMTRTPVDEITPTVWDGIMALNLRAAFFCAVAAARRMQRSASSSDPEQAGSDGVIINIADLAGLEVWTGYIPHGISKAGVLHMTRSLARALAPGIRVNAIAPGTVLLPDDWEAAAADRLERSTPLRRHGTPRDVTEALLYLVGADYVTGETLVVDGGRNVR
jgi:pteridine reductase